MPTQSTYYTFLAILSKSITTSEVFDPKEVCKQIAEYINQLPPGVEWLQELERFVDQHGNIAREDHHAVDWNSLIRSELTRLGYYERFLKKSQHAS